MNNRKSYRKDQVLLDVLANFTIEQRTQTMQKLFEEGYTLAQAASKWFIDTQIDPLYDPTGEVSKNLSKDINSWIIRVQKARKEERNQLLEEFTSLCTKPEPTIEDIKELYKIVLRKGFPHGMQKNQIKERLELVGEDEKSEILAIRTLLQTEGQWAFSKDAHKY